MEHRSSIQSQFETAYQSYSDELFGFCSSKVRYREEAFDIVHDAFVKFWGVLVSRATIDNPRAYLYSIIRNKIIDHYRSVAVHRVFPLNPEMIESLIDGSPDSATAFDTKHALKSINTLSDNYREPIVYRYIDGLPVQDIAKILDTTPGAITKRIHRGIEILRKKYFG